MQIMKVMGVHIEHHFNCYYYNIIIINLPQELKEVLHLDIGVETPEIENQRWPASSQEAGASRWPKFFLTMEQTSMLGCLENKKLDINVRLFRK